MFSNDAFDTWCLEQALSDQAKTLVHQIRSSPPSRLVRSAAGNVSGRYPSKKMGCTIQFESHRGELATIYQSEHDPAIFEYYDQPGPIKLTYPSKKGKPLGVLHTPDFFVLGSDGCGWIECKREEHLVELAEQMPHRYVRADDGSWSCPPGEAVASPLGFFYRIQSSATVNWVYQRNLRFLEDYLRFSRPAMPSSTRDAIRTLVLGEPALTLFKLLSQLSTGTADDVYALIATDQLYVDLSQIPLAEAEQVQVFVDREQAQAYATLRPFSFPRSAPASCCQLTPGTLLWWDGKPWRILNLGETAVTLLSVEKQLVDIPLEVFEVMLTQRKVSIAAATGDEPAGSTNALLTKASPKDLEIATQRYKWLGKVLPEGEGAVVSPRTLQRWRAEYRTAEVMHGHGFTGLIPRWSNSGNHLSRLSPSTEQLIEKYITQHYETLKQQSKHAVYLLLEQEAKENNIPLPSYRTFCTRVEQRPRHEQTLKRQGARAAAQVEPWVWELEQTTPVHGDRPWEIVHLDHTQLDIELVSAQTGRLLGRPWATFLIDAFSRRLLVVYLTFDPPSYRSCMMTLRECVWRYGRFPQTLVVDGGPDFRSTYFEALLAYYSCTKATRPWAKPRYGSVIERLFGTANTQFVHTLTGNTQITKQVRQVTKANDPKQHALWTLGDLYTYFCEWAYEVYETTLHPALDRTPREMFQRGIARTHCLLDYDETFRFFSLPTTPKGTAMVEPGRGVKINHLYYWSDEFRPSTIERTQVPIRYDPFDISVAYAFVQGRWVQCLSQYYLQFKGHSERELLLITTELRKQLRNQEKEISITAKRLAEFLASVQAHEEILTQRLQDREAQDVLAQMSGYQAGLPKSETASSADPPSMPAEPQSEQTEVEGYAGLEIYEEYQ